MMKSKGREKYGEKKCPCYLTVALWLTKKAPRRLCICLVDTYNRPYNIHIDKNPNYNVA